jgi:hypothetical protein
VRVGVFGATGYTGRELVRLLKRHPRASVTFTTGSGGGHLAHENGLEQAAEAYMLALPHGSRPLRGTAADARPGRWSTCQTTCRLPTATSLQALAVRRRPPS